MSEPSAFTEHALRRYLLGLLAEAEGEAIDLALLRDAQAMTALEEAQDGLIEDYLDGALDGEVLRAFEAHFLASPSHRVSLDCARLVRERLQGQGALEGASGRGSGPRYRPGVIGAWLGAVAALLLVVLWVSRPGTDTQTAQGSPSPPAAPSVVPSTPPEASPPAGTPSGPSPPAAPQRVARATFIANAQMAGGSDRQRLTLRGQEAVRLEIVLEGSEAYRELAARLVRADGQVVEWKALKPGPVMVLPLSAPQLPPGVHTLVLTGRDAGQAAPVELDRWELLVDKP